PYIPLKILLLQNLSFVSQHFDEVNLWLNSKEFKDKYERENHPYPPLLNPEKVNDKNYALSYEKIPAKLAWELNLPLPRVYKAVFFIFGASAHGTIWDFFTKSFDLNFNCVCSTYHYSNFDNYIQSQIFYSTKHKDISIFLYLFRPYTKQNHKGIYLASHLPFLILVRDPISRLKTMVNHGGYKSGCSHENAIFNIGSNIDEVLDRRRFWNQDLYPNTNKGMAYLIKCAKNVNFSYTSIAEICKKQVYYMDVSEVNPNRVMQSMRKYAKFFDKDLDEERLESLEGYLKEKKFNLLTYIIPLTMQISLNEEF
ncbi:hypothetical protein CHLV4140_10550, partial [Campylobacter helveticus]|nr:hypothetical protein [Campylobacter helveticus]